ncbi:MAG: M1 family aminopeptidase [Bdellovibrionales bacterium]
MPVRWKMSRLSPFLNGLSEMGPKSESSRRSLKNVILHEMAHMWFGNLVTMKWWDNLWLNESFATYMAALAAAETTNDNQYWRDFDANTKRRTYISDQLKTTHPIAANITDTEVANIYFDNITYGKGGLVS